MAETKKKLAEKEWNFSKLSPEQVPYAFFYEYSRQSDKIKELIKVYRELIPYLDEEAPGEGWFFSIETTRDLTIDQKDEIRSKTELFTENEYLFLIRWLGRCEKFPDTPFLELKEEDYRNGPDVAFNARLFPVNGQGFSEIESCWIKDFQENTFRVDPYHVRYKLPPVAGRGPSGEHVSAHLIRIDWWKSNNELQAEFAEWVEACRQYIKVEPVKTGARGILNQPLDLPKECKKMSTALAHLGSLRCLKATGSWEKYLTVYHTDKSDRRYLEKDVSAARKVISWLEKKVQPYPRRIPSYPIYAPGVDSI